MAERRQGFRPESLQGPPARGIVSQILAGSTPEARGFTEIKVVGVGGGGSNTVNRMIQEEVRGIEFIAVNSDGQALSTSLAPRKLQIGRRATRGLGSGGRPEMGEKAAEESMAEIEEAVRGAHMVFVTAGMGGGTGTGASPLIAEIARSEGALTVGVVTRPFAFEGSHRRAVAVEGTARLREKVDALIVVPNDRLLELADAHTPILESFRLADEVLHQGITGIADLVLTTGLINLDFADVYTIMHSAGSALMAIGKGAGSTRASDAATMALESPLLESSINGAKGVLLNISGGPDLTLHEVHEAADLIAQAVDPDANIIFGAVIQPKLKNQLRLTLIATGFDERYRPAARQAQRERMVQERTAEPKPAIGLKAPPRPPVEPPASRRAPARETPADPGVDLDVPAFLRRRS